VSFLFWAEEVFLWRSLALALYVFSTRPLSWKIILCRMRNPFSICNMKWQVSFRLQIVLYVIPKQRFNEFPLINFWRFKIVQVCQNIRRRRMSLLPNERLWKTDFTIHCDKETLLGWTTCLIKTFHKHIFKFHIKF
jgi:hypothetical protein